MDGIKRATDVMLAGKVRREVFGGHYHVISARCVWWQVMVTLGKVAQRALEHLVLGFLCVKLTQSMPCKLLWKVRAHQVCRVDQ